MHTDYNLVVVTPWKKTVRESALEESPHLESRIYPQKCASRESNTQNKTRCAQVNHDIDLLLYLRNKRKNWEELQAIPEDAFGSPFPPLDVFSKYLTTGAI